MCKNLNGFVTLMGGTNEPRLVFRPRSDVGRLWSVTDYAPPLRDIRYVLDEVSGFPDLLETDRFGHVDQETVQMVLGEVGRWIADVVAPTNVDGDTIHTTWHEDGSVVTPDSFKAAYRQYVESGFGAIPFEPDFGGGGFPWVVGLAIQEMLTSANMAFSLCPLLTQGAIDAFLHHGSDDQKNMFLPKMLTGEWAGTMNLSEPQAGSDVGAVATKAIPVGDGSYRITGQKIWITYGEHDMADNIIHLVLARTPGAPPGTRGITMFVVPKFLINDDGTLGERNDVQCVSIEHKLGIHGSPTCVLSYGDNDGAIGWPVGDEFTGMRNMFTMMNNARLSVGLQGLSLAERSFQDGLDYAMERRQGTARGAEKGTQSPIIDHPDVRRMLMTQRAWIDAMRLLTYRNAVAIDRSSAAADPDERSGAQELADLLIPLSKGLCTDLGSELTSITLQIYGGMGYVEESGVAQHYRDIRIGPIYEGTNGIQAADLVGRKLSMRGGGVIFDLLAEFEEAATELSKSERTAQFGANLVDACLTARRATEWLLGVGDPDDALAGSSPFLRLLGTVVCGGFMAQSALHAAERMASGAGPEDSDFYESKFVAAVFFGEQILPTANGLLGAVQAGADDLFALTPDQFR